MMDIVKEQLMQAIQAGAPVYNQGRPDKCYDIYQAVATGLLDSGVASEAAATALREALLASSKQDSPDAQAWTMRRAFDSIPDGSLEMQAKLANISGPEYPVLDLTDPTQITSMPGWFVMDDVIMGGVSSSGIKLDVDSKALVFSGNVTTDSNGGFASVRSEPWSGWSLLAKAQGIRLVVKGDGRVYKITTKTDNRYDGVQYQHDFFAGPDLSQAPSLPTIQSSVQADGWQVVDLPFASFTPNFRGQPVRNQPPLTGASIRQLGLMVSKFAATGGTTPGFRNGAFRLALRSIRGFV